jgi:hypothetical protein
MHTCGEHSERPSVLQAVLSKEGDGVQYTPAILNDEAPAVPKAATTDTFCTPRPRTGDACASVIRVTPASGTWRGPAGYWWREGLSPSLDTLSVKTARQDADKALKSSYMPQRAADTQT